MDSSVSNIFLMDSKCLCKKGLGIMQLSKYKELLINAEYSLFLYEYSSESNKKGTSYSPQ